MTGVTVSPAAKTLAPGETMQFTAAVEPDNATDKSGVWSSSDEAKATVDNSGLATVKPDATPGDVNIIFTTTDGGKTAGGVVTVSGA